jgi:hypothetical protein
LKPDARLAKLPAMRMLARAVCVALPLALAIPAVAAPQTALAADGEDDNAIDAADVKIEVRLENGKVVKHNAEVPAMEMDHKIEFEGEGHFHELTLNIKKTGKGKLSVRLAYDRDATPIIAPYTTDFKAKKREVLWAENIALALTIKPKKVKPKDTSRDEDDQLQPDESDDPLGKLEKKQPKKKKKKKKK